MKYFASRISENLHKTPEGYLLAIGVSIGRTGEMEYGHGETPLEVGEDGIVRVTRDEEELFKPETIASFQGKPFTIRHPEQFVDAKNWKELAKGIIQNVRRGKGEQDQDLVADILITDQIAISLVENGMRQLSCGYEAEYLQTGPGTGIQKNIVGNHLALVEEGRAGDAYKINDAKGVRSMNKKLEAALKRLFGKTADQIMKEAEEKEAAEKAAASKKAKAKDSKGYDELVAMCKDLMSKVEKLGQPQDEDKDDDKDKDKSEDEEVAPAIEDRLKALEAAVAKLVERESKEDEVPVDDEAEEEEVVVDEDDGEEAEDEDVEEDGPTLTGDDKSKLEILAPGLAPTKDFKSAALKQAYKTEDGKKHIDALTGGKPTFDSAEQVSILFNAVPELLKGSRGSSLARTKTKDWNSAIFAQEDTGAMTAEKINEMNAKHYNQRK